MKDYGQVREPIGSNGARNELITNKKNGVISLFNEPWSLLKYRFYGKDTFHIVLALGNFISHLDSTKKINEALLDLFNLLKPGGTLVIDHRNFDKLEKSLRATNPFDDYNSRYLAKYMYCGENVRPGPELNQKSGKIRWFFRDMTKNNRIESNVEMVPIKDDFFVSQLKLIGFEDIDTYYDYEINQKFRGEDSKVEKDPNCDFFVYVATKPI